MARAHNASCQFNNSIKCIESNRTIAWFNTESIPAISDGSQEEKLKMI